MTPTEHVESRLPFLRAAVIWLKPRATYSCGMVNFKSAFGKG